MIRRPPRPPLFPSPPLSRSLLAPRGLHAATLPPTARPRGDSVVVRWNQAALQGVRDSKLGPPMVARALAIVHTCAYEDRKSTRLNSSHDQISYAVFCLKKQK